ncbi:MAG: hypothetical protein ACT6WE_06600 [Shinella sp.]|uniref:hypothetical protein n=1 Tax=Shinella sp. TaxID=1870904 RepID=UPI0040360594
MTRRLAARTSQRERVFKRADCCIAVSPTAIQTKVRDAILQELRKNKNTPAPTPAENQSGRPAGFSPGQAAGHVIP